MTYKCGKQLIQKTWIQGLFSGLVVSSNVVVLLECRGSMILQHSTLSKALPQALAHGNQLVLLIHCIFIRFQDKTMDASVSWEANIISAFI